MRKLLLTLCAAATLLMGCAAKIPYKADPGKPAKIKAVVIFPSDARYPIELWSAGVQGDVELRVELGADGVPISVTLESSSRSRELDQLAMSIGRDLKYEVKNATSPVTIIVPVKFSRDSLETLLRQKTCFEFNVDVAYFKATFPEVKTRKMNAINLMAGIFFGYGLQKVPKEEHSAYDARLTAATEKIIDACAKAPEAGYAKTFADLVMVKK